MKTGIITFEQHLGRSEIGSSRIRGRWIVNKWKEAGIDLGECELFKIGQKYDVVIFQKAYWPEYAQSFKGIKILDLCDPDWRHFMYPIKEMIEACDAVTCSSLEIAKYIIKLTDKPVVFIPDRIDFDLLPPPKNHKGTGETKAVAWYGYDTNFPMLESCLPALKKRNLGLIVVSNKVFSSISNINIADLTNLSYSDATFMQDLQKGDVVLNPKMTKGKWKYKSNNKTTLAWALGLPVAHTDLELDCFAGENERIIEVEKRYAEVKRDYDIKLSVIELKNLIHEIQTQKAGAVGKGDTESNS